MASQTRAAPRNNGHHTAQEGAPVDERPPSAGQLFNEATHVVNEIQEYLDIKVRVQRNPYGTLAAAMGIRYVLGGGLFTPFTTRLVRLGIRFAALPMVKDELMNMAEAAVDGFARKR